MLEKQTWMTYAQDFHTEWRQMWDEGKDVAAFQEACKVIEERAKNKDCNKEEVEALYRKMESAPLRQEYPYVEPSLYDEIVACAKGASTISWSDVLTEEELKVKLRGAWLGRIAGCLLGKPFEFLRTPEILEILHASKNYPLVRYGDSREFPEGLAEKMDTCSYANWRKLWIDRIEGSAPPDDDTNYTVLAMKVIDQYGADFTPDQMLEAWLTWMPMFSTCTAERVAYRNAGCGLQAPDTATYQNPYREWIGAQIRGDFFGYMNPGNPTKAAEMAWRDASISHKKNGIYGEMFAAAMIAKAAVCDDMIEVLQTGISVIPEKSRLGEEIQKVIQWYQNGKKVEEAFEKINEEYDEFYQHHWCHTLSNAMIVATALLYGEKDFGKTICMAVEHGFDTDCNAATAGSVLGMMLGENDIPEYWGNAFNKTLRTDISGYHKVSVDELTDKTVALIHKAS